MSERGSFVTEYINCGACFEAAKKVLLSQDKTICSTVIPSWSLIEKEIPIIAGKVGGGSYSCGEFTVFEEELIPELEKTICHPMRVAVLTDESKNKIYVVKPKK